MEHNLVQNGKNYTVQPLPAKRGLRLFVRCGRFMGPGLGQLIGLQQGGAKASITGDQMEALMRATFQDLDQPGLEETVEELMSSIEEDGVNLATRWTVVFAGRLKDLYAVLLFAVGAHFGDFLPGFAGSGSFTAPKKAEPLETKKNP